MSDDEKKKKFREVYDDEELVRTLLAQDDWQNFNKLVPKSGLGFCCDMMKCDNDPKFRCSSCLVTWYCSPACQKKHWKTHKQKCLSYKKAREQNKTICLTDEGETFYPDSFGQSNMDLDWTIQGDPINQECQICLEAHIDPKVSVVLPCRHQFCTPCIVDWQKGDLMDRRSLNPRLRDQCPTCRRKPMPVVEKCLLQRLNRLYREACFVGWENDRKKRMNVEMTERDQESEHNRLFQLKEALVLADKVLLSKNHQKNIYIRKAEILMELGQSTDAFGEVGRLIEELYRTAPTPIIKEFAEYDQALEEGNQDKEERLRAKMIQLLRRMDPYYAQ
ncbi:MAG: hypothetical protein SGARI_005982, partial [Bacillariaceae sp.]